MDPNSYSSSIFTETKNAKPNHAAGANNTQHSETTIAVIIDGDALLTACSDAFQRVRELLLSSGHERNATTCIDELPSTSFPATTKTTSQSSAAGERHAAVHSSYAFLPSYLHQLHQEIVQVSDRTARKSKSTGSSSSKDGAHVVYNDRLGLESNPSTRAQPASSAFIYRYVFTDFFLNSLVLLSGNEGGLTLQSKAEGGACGANKAEEFIVECMRNIPHCHITVLRSRPPTSTTNIIHSTDRWLSSFLTLAVPKNSQAGEGEVSHQQRQLAVLCSPICGSSAVPSTIAALSIKHLQPTAKSSSSVAGGGGKVLENKKEPLLSVILVSPNYCFGGEEGTQRNAMQSFLQEALASRVWSVIEAIQTATSTTPPAYHHNGADAPRTALDTIRVVGIPMMTDKKESTPAKEEARVDSRIFSDYIRVPSLSIEGNAVDGKSATAENAPIAFGSVNNGGLTESDLDALFEDFTVKKSVVGTSKKGEEIDSSGPISTISHLGIRQTKGDNPNPSPTEAKHNEALNLLGNLNNNDEHRTTSSPSSNSISNHNYAGTAMADGSSGGGRRPTAPDEGDDEFVKTLFSRRMRSEKALKRRLHAIYLKIMERETTAASVAATAMSPTSQLSCDLKKKYPITNFDILLSCCAPPCGTTRSSTSPATSSQVTTGGGTTFATLLPLLSPPSTAPTNHHLQSKGTEVSGSTCIADKRRLFSAQVFYDGVSYKRHYFASVSPSPTPTAGGAASTTSWEHPLGSFFTQHLESQSSKFLERQRRLDSQQPQERQKYYHLLSLLAAFVKPEDVSRYAREEAIRRLKWGERIRNNAGELPNLTFSNEDAIKFAKTLEDSIQSELLDLVQLSTTSEEGAIYHSLLLLASEELSALLEAGKVSSDRRAIRSLLADDEEFRSLFENSLANTAVSSIKESDYFDQPRDNTRRTAMYFPNIDLANATAPNGSTTVHQSISPSPPLRLSHVGNDFFLLFLQECRRIAVLEEAMHPLRSWAAVVDEEVGKDEGEEVSESTLAPLSSSNLPARETEGAPRHVENNTQIGKTTEGDSSVLLRGESWEEESKGTIHHQQNKHQPQHQHQRYEDPFSFDGVNDLIGTSSEAPPKNKKKFEAAAIVADLFDGEDDGHNNTTSAIGGGLLGLNNDEKRGLSSENNFFGVVTPVAGGSQGASLSGSLPLYTGGSGSSFSRPLPQPKVADLLQNTTPKPAAWIPMNTTSNRIGAAEEHNTAKINTTTNSVNNSVNAIPTISVLPTSPAPVNPIQLNNGSMPTLTASASTTAATKYDGGSPPLRTTTTDTEIPSAATTTETGKTREGNVLPQNDDTSPHAFRDQFRQLKLVSHNDNTINNNNVNNERSTISEHFAARKPLASGPGGAVIVPQGPVLSVHANSSSTNSHNKMVTTESNPSKNENPKHFANNGIRLSANTSGTSNSVPAAPAPTTPASPLTPASPTQADVDRIRALLPDGFDCQLFVKEGKPNRIVYIDHKSKSTSWAPPAGMR